MSDDDIDRLQREHEAFRRKHNLPEDKFILNGRVPEACSNVLRWGRWFETADRHVAKTQVGGINVSTVFLGLNHQWGNGPPMHFETMCFVDHEERAKHRRARFEAAKRGESYDDGEEAWEHELPFNRYSTWEQAEAGHAAAVLICKSVLANAAEATDDLMARLKAAMEKKE